MLRLLAIHSSVVVAITSIMTLSFCGLTSARSIRLDDDFWSTTGDVIKRNSWWSKKSLDAQPVASRDTQEDSTFDDLPLISSINRDALQPKFSSVFDCYVSDCVPRFVECVQHALTRRGAAECRTTHELCALICSSSQNRVI